MATYTAQEAIDLLDSSFSDLLDSGGEEEIEEDPSFPLPRPDSDSEDEVGPTTVVSYPHNQNNMIIQEAIIRVVYT